MSKTCVIYVINGCVAETGVGVLLSCGHAYPERLDVEERAVSLQLDKTLPLRRAAP